MTRMILRMKKTDNNLLKEIQNEALDLLAISGDCAVAWQGGVFELKDVKEMLIVLRLNIVYMRYDRECFLREQKDG